jgi:hypothetical protein
MRFNFYPGDKPHQKPFDDDEIAEFKIGKNLINIAKIEPQHIFGFIP